MSTGLELADFDNSIWKPAPKGYRSALRRSRDLDKMSKDADDKIGVAVDALPLKKRRFSSPSNSPPSMTRSQETEECLGPNKEAEFEIERKQRCRSAGEESRKKRCGEIEENSKFIDYIEDFSGIEILAAAAACDNIIDDEEDMTREGVDSSASAVLFEENLANGKDLALENKKETSSLPSRLHWDLNSLMDAWELPCNTSQDDSHTDVVNNDLMAGNVKTEMEDKCKRTSVGIVHDAKSSSQNEEACISRSITEENRDAQLSDCAWRPCGEISSSDTQLKLVPCSISEKNRDTQLSSPAWRPCGEISSPDTQLELVPSAVKVKHEQNTGGFAFREDPNNCAVKVKLEQNNGNFVFREDPKKPNCGTTCSVSSDVENPSRASGSDEDKQLVQDMCKSVSHDSLEADHAKQSRSVGSASEGQSVVSLDAKQLPNQVSSVENGSDSEHIKVEKLMEKACVESLDERREGTSKVTRDPSDDSYESGVYQDDKIRNSGRTNSAEIQAGHDSQIEDGELRESDACHRDENDDENREDELLDYGSESDEERHCSIDKAKDQRIETCGTADPAIDESDRLKTITSDVTTDKDFLSEGVGSRTSNKEEGSNLMHGKDVMMRSSGATSTHSRDEMVSDKETHTPLRSRIPGGLDSERRGSNSYLSGYANGPRGMKSMEDQGYAPYDTDVGTRRFARFDNHSSNRRFEHSNGTRSSSNCMNRLYVRDNSGTSNSFRRSSQDRGGFYKTAPEDSSAFHSNRLAHRLSLPRRERSISPVGRGVRGFARFDNHAREQFPNRNLNSRFEHCNGRSSANGRLYVRNSDSSPTSTSFRRSPERGGFYKPVMEDNPVGRGVRGFARFDNHVREQFPNRSLNSRFEQCNGRSSANGRLYVRDGDNSPTSTSFRRSPERGGFYKPVMEDNPVDRGVRGFARFDNHVREQFPDRALNSRFEHCNGRSSGNGRLYVRDRGNSPTSTSFRRSPERGGFYKAVMEDNSAYPNRLVRRVGMPRTERSVSPVGRGTRGFVRFENHVRGQFVNRSSNSMFEHSNGTRYSAGNGMNRLYGRDSSPSIGLRRSPQGFDRGEGGGFFKPALEGMGRRERSISPVGRGHSESRSRGRASYVSAGEQIEGSRLRSRSPDVKPDKGEDAISKAAAHNWF